MIIFRLIGRLEEISAEVSICRQLGKKIHRSGKMQCWQCGKDLEENRDFCISCGAPRTRPSVAGEEGSPEEKVHALLAEANLLRLRKNWTGAIARCTEALKLAPNSASAHSLLGDICRDEGRFQDAIEWYKLALGLDNTRKRDRDKLDTLIDKIYGAGKPPSRPKEGKTGSPPEKKRNLQYSNILVLTGFFVLAVILLGGLIYLLVYRQRMFSSPFNPGDVILTPPSSPGPKQPSLPTPEGEANAREANPGEAPVPTTDQNSQPKYRPTPAGELSGDLYLREKKIADTLKGILSQAGGGANLLGVALDPRNGKLEISFSLPASDNAETARAAMLETAYYLARAAALEERAVTTITTRGAMKFPAGEGVDDVPAFIGDAEGAQLRKTPDSGVTPQEAEGFFTNIWWLAMLERDSGPGQ
jgi:hypothetical protein